MAVDLEELAQLLARIRAAESISTEGSDATAREKRTDLIGKKLDVISRRDDRSAAVFEAGLQVRYARLLLRMEPVPALRGQCVAPQFVR